MLEKRKKPDDKVFRLLAFGIPDGTHTFNEWKTEDFPEEEKRLDNINTVVQQLGMEATLGEDYRGYLTQGKMK